MTECQTVSVEEAAKRLGIGRQLAYQAARSGAFPVEVIRVGRRYLIPVAGLDQLLGPQQLRAE